MCTQVPRLIISLMKYEYATAISRSDLHQSLLVDAPHWSVLITRAGLPLVDPHLPTMRTFMQRHDTSPVVLMLESVLVLFKSFPDAELAALVVSCLDFGSLPPLFAESMNARFFYLVFVVFYVDEFSVVSWLLLLKIFLDSNFVGILLTIFRDETVTFKSKCLYRPRPLVRLNRL